MIQVLNATELNVDEWTAALQTLSGSGLQDLKILKIQSLRTVIEHYYFLLEAALAVLEHPWVDGK